MHLGCNTSLFTIDLGITALAQELRVDLAQLQFGFFIYFFGLGEMVCRCGEMVVALASRQMVVELASQHSP